MHLWGCLCLQIKETWPKWAGIGFVVSQCVGRMLQTRALREAVVLSALSYCFRCSPCYQMVVHSNCDNFFSLGRGRERSNRLYFSTMDFKEEEKWGRWWETKWTDTIKTWARAGMAEERREAAQTELEREISGLRMKERRGTLGHQPYLSKTLTARGTGKKNWKNFSFVLSIYTTWLFSWKIGN